MLLSKLPSHHTDLLLRSLPRFVALSLCKVRIPGYSSFENHQLIFQHHDRLQDCLIMFVTVTVIHMLACEMLML